MKTLFSTLCVLVLVTVFPVVFVLTLIRYQLLNPSVLKQVARSAMVGETIPSIIASNAGVSEAEVIKFLPTKTAYSITDTVIDTFTMTLLNGKGKINLKPLKAELEPVVKQFATKSNDEIDYMEIPPFSLKDEVTLAELMAGDSKDDREEAPTLDAAQFSWLPVSVIVGWVVMTVALLGLILLKMKPLRNLLKWLGITTTILTIETVPLIITFWALPSVITPLLNDMDTNLRRLLSSVIEGLSATLASTTVWVGLTLLVITIILFVSRVFVKPRQA